MTAGPATNLPKPFRAAIQVFCFVAPSHPQILCPATVQELRRLKYQASKIVYFNSFILPRMCDFGQVTLCASGPICEIGRII